MGPRSTWLLVIPLIVTGVASACGSDDGSKKSRLPPPGDAGAGGGDGVAAGAGGTTSSSAGQAPVDAGAGGAPVDAGGAPAGGQQAGGAAGEVGTGESGAGGALGLGGAGGAPGAALNVIYATFDGMLVRLDPETAALVEIDTVRNAAQPATIYPDLALAWDHQQGVARALVNLFTAPQLGVIDLCTGLVTLGPSLTLNAAPITNAEAFTQHPDGTFYVGSGTVQYYSPTLGTLNVTTGAVTNIGSYDTTQDDADHYTFAGDQLYVLDVGTAVYGWYRLSLTTGAATLVAEPPGTSANAPLRIDFDETRQQAFGWRLNDRQLLAVSVDDASTTPIGQTHPANAYANAPVRGFMSAPLASCP